ncbi:MAG: hypothetical protein R3E95_01455 [Thiolinea sp.]
MKRTSSNALVPETPSPKKQATLNNISTESSESEEENSGMKLESEPESEPIVKAEPGGRASNGNTLHLYFFAMGQGDSTLIITPGNKIFIIDIGSSFPEKDKASEDLSKKNLDKFFLEPKIFGASQEIEGLIFTHSDKDHHNYIGMLQKIGNGELEKDLTVNAIYHGDMLSAYKDLRDGQASYTRMKQLCQTIGANADDIKIRAVTYNGAEDFECKKDDGENINIPNTQVFTVDEEFILDEKTDNFKTIPISNDLQKYHIMKRTPALQFTKRKKTIFSYDSQAGNYRKLHRL